MIQSCKVVAKEELSRVKGDQSNEKERDYMAKRKAHAT
jgi:hypothetical protein